MFRHVDHLQFQAKPEKPDALFARKMQELVGGQFGEMTVMMQYLLTTMLARLLEGAPNETTEKAAAANPVLAAVLGGMSPQHAIVSGGSALPRDSEGTPWNTGYIVASGNLLTDFRSNVAAEAQSRLMTSRVYHMTDDRGVKDMLQFNLARDTYHQQQWLLGIEQLIEDGHVEHGIETSNFDEDDGSQGPGKTGGGVAAHGQGIANIANKIKGALD